MLSQAPFSAKNYACDVCETAWIRPIKTSTVFPPLLFLPSFCLCNQNQISRRICILLKWLFTQKLVCSVSYFIVISQKMKVLVCCFCFELELYGQCSFNSGNMSSSLGVMSTEVLVMVSNVWDWRCRTKQSVLQLDPFTCNCNCNCKNNSVPNCVLLLAVSCLFSYGMYTSAFCELSDYLIIDNFLNILSKFSWMLRPKQRLSPHYLSCSLNE